MGDTSRRVVRILFVATALLAFGLVRGSILGLVGAA